MTVADDVLDALCARPGGMKDTDLAKILDKNHPYINQVCRRLADQGLIAREHCYGAIVNGLNDGAAAADPQAGQGVSTMTAEWAWEGNVQSRVATYLAGAGWSIIRVADTAQRERGVDIIAERGGQRLLVEAKGWPSSTYARGEHAGQPKQTQPSTQASIWFAEGLVTLIRRGGTPGAHLGLALPDIQRYRTLLDEVEWALGRLGITVFLVSAQGAVEVVEREN